MFDRPIPDSLDQWPRVTARAILDHDVGLEISAYRDRQDQGNVLWLDLPSLRKAIAAGEARVGSRDLAVPAIDPAFVRRAAAEALADGIVLMFVDGRPISNLDEIQEVRLGSQVRYLRLSAQRGM